MINKLLILIIISLLSFSCMSAEERYSLFENERTSKIAYKNDSINSNLNKAVKIMPVFLFILFFLGVSLYLLKPTLLKIYFKENISSGKIKLNEIKRLPHNVVLYLMDIDKFSVLLIKSGNSISAMKLGTSSNDVEIEK
jgi:hypothetical protein